MATQDDVMNDVFKKLTALAPEDIETVAGELAKQFPAPPPPPGAQQPAVPSAPAVGDPGNPNFRGPASNFDPKLLQLAMQALMGSRQQPPPTAPLQPTFVGGGQQPSSNFTNFF